MLSESLAANPKLDIQQFFRQEYEGSVPLVAIMKDGRVVSTHGPKPSDGFVQDIRARLNVDPDSFVRGRGGRGRAGWPSSHEARRWCAAKARQQTMRRTGPAGAVIVDGVPVGVVIALPHSALRQLGPTLALVGAVLVVLGTTVAALLIFGPVRRGCEAWRTLRAKSAPAI